MLNQVRKRRVLIVDDEELTRQVTEYYLVELGHDTEHASDGIEALAKIQLDIDLVLCDVNMPGMDGFEVVRKIRADAENGNIPVIMVTSLDSREDRLRALEAGANDFIAKPLEKTELKVRIDNAMKIKDSQDELKQYAAQLEDKVETRTAHLRKSLEETVQAQRSTQKAYLETLKRLAIAAEFKDPNTAAHIMRMSEYCAVIARKLHLPPGEVEIILHASPMHDVGKIGIPDEILFKPGKLNDEEFEIIKEHTMIGKKLLGGSNNELLQVSETIAYSHHEKWDGSGYPQGLSGEDIPLYGRISSVADLFDALTSKRHYKEKFSNETAYKIIEERRGGHLEPKLVDVFFDSLDDILKIQEKNQ